MATRSWPGFGPVFAYEWLTASRRWQGYALRSLLVLLLLLGLSGVWLGHHDGTGELSVRQLAEIGRAFYAVTTLIFMTISIGNRLGQGHNVRSLRADARLPRQPRHLMRPSYRSDGFGQGLPKRVGAGRFA